MKRPQSLGKELDTTQHQQTRVDGVADDDLLAKVNQGLATIIGVGVVKIANGAAKRATADSVHAAHNGHVGVIGGPGEIGFCRLSPLSFP